MMKLFGGIFIAVGLIIMGLSGLCTGYFLLMFLTADGGGFGGGAGALMLPLIIGGVPFAVGFGLFFGGRKMIQAANEEERRN